MDALSGSHHAFGAGSGNGRLRHDARPARRHRVAAILVATALLAPFGAAANDFELCNRSGSDPDTGIPACTRLLEQQADSINTPGVYNNRGVAKVRIGDYRSAVDDFTSALDRNPRYVDALKNRGVAWQMLGDIDRALADFNQAIRIDRKSPALFNARGSALLSRDEFDRAVADFDAAIALDGNFAKAYTNRGLAHLFRRRLSQAMADFDQVVRLVPDDPLGYINRAIVRLDKGDLAGAIADYDEAIRRNPGGSAAYSRRGEAWRLKGDLDLALADHNKAIELEPSAEAYNNRALVWRDKGDLEKAFADCAEAILIAPKNYLAYANRGDLYRLRGELERALSDLNRAVNLNPKSPVALTFRGHVLRERGDLDRALADFTEALRQVPDFVAALTGRGMAQERKGNAAAAKADFEKAVSLPAEIDAALAKPAQQAARERLAALSAAEAARAKAAEEATRQKAAAEQSAREAAAQVARAEAEERRRRIEVEARAKVEADARARADLEARLKADLDARAKEEVEARVKAALERQAKATAPALRGPRVALVVANANYRNTKVPVAAADAEEVAAALRRLGFEVVEARDLNKREMERHLGRFARLAQNSAVALVYYAGLGFQFGNRNFLVPIDAQLEDEVGFDFEGFRLDDVLTAISRARGAQIVLLDASRPNPLANRPGRPERVPPGLAKLDAPKGAAVVYAAQPNGVVEDGPGRNGAFGQAVVRMLGEPDLELRAGLRRLVGTVDRTTKGRQIPYLSSALEGELQLGPAPPAPVAAAQSGLRLSGLPDERGGSPVDEETAWKRLEEEQQRRAERLGALAAPRPAQLQPGSAAPTAPQSPVAFAAQNALGTSIRLSPVDLLDLALAIQQELARHGCYAGTIDGQWDGATTQRAVRDFARVARLSEPDLPSAEFLAALTSQQSRVCIEGR